jgi:putative SOS response-associated peptidase YedK
MCFTVNVNLVKEEIEERYGVTFPGKYRYEPSYYYHAFGLPELPAICSGDPGSVRLLKWGLIPSWVRNETDAEEIRLKTFNARAESIESKPSFSSSFKTRRCIIPVKGFYEWQHTAKGKIPWYICGSDDEILSLAGLFSEWVRSATGEVLSTFTVITTDANEIMAEIHNSKKWIDLSIPASEALGLLRPSPEEMLKAHTISPLVNNRYANRNTPEVIKPFNYNTDILFS